MDWRLLLDALLVVLGGGGLTGLSVAYKRLSEAKVQAKIATAQIEQSKQLNQANIQTVRAEMDLKLEQARIGIINDLQEERNAARELINDLREEVSLLRGRISILESLLRANNIPVPE